MSPKKAMRIESGELRAPMLNLGGAYITTRCRAHILLIAGALSAVEACQSQSWGKFWETSTTSSVITCATKVASDAVAMVCIPASTTGFLMGSAAVGGTATPYTDADSKGPIDGINRVYRGGTWQNSATFLRGASRVTGIPWGTSSDIGFRPVRRP